MQNRFVSFVAMGIAFVLSSSSVHAQGPFTGKPQYQIEVKRADTTMGKIIVEMFPAIAPMSVRNWDSLVNIHFYDGSAFHRVIPGFMIQGGDPNSIDGDPSTWGFGDETQTTVDAEFSAVSHRRGILSAARLGNDVNSATSQFFICVANPTYLDRNYSVYGQVVSGMSVADAIVKAPRDANDRPDDKISMYITRLGSNDSVTPVPVASSPAAGYQSTNGKVTFSWTLVPGAMMYELQIAKDAAFQFGYADSTYSQVTKSATISKIAPGTYYWRMLANNGGNASAFTPTAQFTVASSGVSDPSATSELSLDAYLDPSSSSACLRYYLAQATHAKLTVTDDVGRVVLAETNLQAGGHVLPLASLTAGVYFCRLQANGESLVRRIFVK